MGFLFDHINPTGRRMHQIQKRLEKEMKRVQERNSRTQNEYRSYSSYSDVAERKKRLQEEKRREIINAQCDINEYKYQSINKYLQSQNLIEQTGIDVSLESVKYDGDAKINNEETFALKKECCELQEEVNEINVLISKINEAMEVI